MVQLLALSKRHVEVMLKGRGALKAGTTRGITTFKVNSRVAFELSLSVEAYVLPRISGHFPSANLVEIPLVNITLEELVTLINPSLATS
jgi:hypothetical protein